MTLARAFISIPRELILHRVVQTVDGSGCKAQYVATQFLGFLETKEGNYAMVWIPHGADNRGNDDGLRR